MAFTSPNTGDRIEASHITQIIDAWTGSSGAGEPLTNVQVTDASNYAGDFQNLHADSLGLRVRDTSSNELLKAVLAGCTLSKTTTLSRGTITTDLKVLDASATWNAAVTFTALKLNVTDSSSNAASLLMDLQVGGSSKAWVKKNGDIYSATCIYVNDNANANMTNGITLNQGAATNEIMAFKASDVAHAMTDLTETDTYGDILRNTTTGGLIVQGFDGNTIALFLRGVATNADTAKTTSAAAPIALDAYLKAGAGKGAVSANGNLVRIMNNTNVRFIFDAEGSAHGDVEFTTFDTHDDIALLNALSDEFQRDVIKDEFGIFVSEHRAELERISIVGKDSWRTENGKTRAMVNFTKLSMLHTGALRQLGKELKAVTDRLAVYDKALGISEINLLGGQ